MNMKLKTFLLAILMVMVVAMPSFAVTTWYACEGTQNIDHAGLWNDAANCAGNTLTWDNQVAGDTFNSNSYTALAINVDPQGTGASKGTVTITTGASGGGFTYATATAITMTMNVVAGTTSCLAISGTTNATRTITGNVYGSTTTAARSGITLTFSVGTLVIGGNVVGGEQTTAYGFTHASSGAVTVNGNCTGMTSNACRTDQAQLTVLGNCIGSSTTVAIAGCSNIGTIAIIVNGNLIYGSLAQPVSGPLIWLPSDESKYIQIVGGTDVYASVAPSKTKVATDTSVVVSTTGAYEAGTYASGGGTTAYGW
jgi:hypothetical protein